MENLGEEELTENGLGKFCTSFFFLFTLKIRYLVLIKYSLNPYKWPRDFKRKQTEDGGVFRIPLNGLVTQLWKCKETLH